MGIRLTDNDYKFIIIDPQESGVAGLLVDKGEVRLINDILCLAIKDYTAEDDLLCAITSSKQAIADKAQGAGTAMSPGELVYIDLASQLVSTTQGAGDILCGHVIRAAGTTDATVDIDYDGRIWNLA